MRNTSELRNDINAQALRSFASSGFGDAPIGCTKPHSLLDSIELDHQARTYRASQLTEIVKATLQAAGGRVRRMVARWKRQQRARATYVSLLALDARTLRDLGLHRCELASVAAEASGNAYLTRCRFVPIRPSKPLERSLDHS